MGLLADQIPDLYNRMNGASRMHNIIDFSRSLGILNQYNQPLLEKIVAYRVPVIILTNENINDQKILKPQQLKNQLRSAIAFYYSGIREFKTFAIIYLSTLKQSLMGLIRESVPLKVGVFDAVEQTMMHETIHAYLNLIGYNEHNRYLRDQIVALWEVVWQQKNLFTRQELDIMEMCYYGVRIPASQTRSNIEEIVCWCTMPVTVGFLKKVIFSETDGKVVNAFDQLMTYVGTYDKDGVVELYLRRGEAEEIRLRAKAMIMQLRNKNQVQPSFELGGGFFGGFGGGGELDTNIEADIQAETEAYNLIAIYKAVYSKLNMVYAILSTDLSNDSELQHRFVAEMQTRLNVVFPDKNITPNVYQVLLKKGQALLIEYLLNDGYFDAWWHHKKYTYSLGKVFEVKPLLAEAENKELPIQTFNKLS